MKPWLLIFLFFSMSGTSYAASKMAIREDQEQQATPPDKAEIIFLRRPGIYIWSRSMAFRSIFDVTDGEPQFIGILYQGNKLAYFVEPGNYTFMVFDGGARYMRANMVGGKTYYAISEQNCATGFYYDCLMPIRNGSEGIYQIDSNTMQNWLTKAKFVENTEASILWAEKNHDRIFKKHKKFWKHWEKKSDKYIVRHTLEESDGI